MKIDNILRAIRIACKIADWFSVEQHVDYDFDMSLDVLFAKGRIVFYNGKMGTYLSSLSPIRLNGHDIGTTI